MKKLLTIIICAMGIVLLEAKPVEPAVLEVRPPGGMGTLGTVYTNIQQAIDDANPFDIIEVAAGTYDMNTVGPDWHLVIDKANLTLKSEEGKDNTIINVRNGVGIDIRAGAVNFVLGGADSNGFTITGGADTTFVIQLTSAPSGVEISHNTIDTTGNASMGISVGAAGAADLTISNNDFVAESGDGCIWGPRLVNLTVSDNTFDGGSYAIQTSGVTSSSPSVISGNIITGFTGSGGIMICNGEETSDLTITGNTITGCTNGIRFAEYCAQGTAGDMTTVTVEDNTLSTNDKGIRIGDGVHVLASNFTIQNNCFNGNTTYGLENQHATELVTAEENAWSDPNGPYHPDTNPYASGDEVSDNVDYYPWYPDCTFTTLVYKPVHNVTLDAYYDNIKPAVAEATSGDLITVDPGTYVEDGQIFIDKDLTIKGIGGSKPVVNTNANTGSSGDPRGWWLVDSGVTLNLENLVLDGSGYLVYQAIRHKGQGTIESVDFKNIKFNESGPTYSGVGVAAFGTGAVDINSCAFEEIGRIGVLYFYPTVNGSVYSNCTYTGKGPGDWLDYGVELGAGAEAEIKDSTITDCNGVASVDGSTSAGILATTYYGAGTEGTITGNTLTTNSAGMALGYGDADTTVVTARCNLISGNFEYGIKAEPNCSVDAENNWWGSASGPSGVGGGSGDAVSEYVDFFPWLLSADCEDTAEVVADYVVDDDWVGLPMFTQVFFDSTAYYIGLNAFDTIQGAIDAASDGNSISVADGNYVETLVIGKSVKVIGAGGETSIVQSSTGLKLISINAADTEVELAGFTLRHTGTDNWGSSYVMLIENGAYAYIHDNVVDDFKKRGIYVMGSGSSADIVANTIIGGGEGSGLQNGIVVWNSGGGFTNIVNNEVSGGYYTGERWTATGIMALDTYDKDVLIAGNYVHDNQLGIAAGNYCEYTPGSYSADVTIRANRVEYNTYGIDIFNDIRGALVQGNYISASTEYAIGVSDYNDTMAPCEQPTDTIIQFNNIADNNLGMWVIDRVGPVDAQYNWWGDISGPNDPCGTSETDGITCYDVSTMKNVDGLGDEVTENVDYCPWLTAAISRSDDPLSLGDLNGDGCVNFYDVAILADEWLEGCE